MIICTCVLYLHEYISVCICLCESILMHICVLCIFMFFCVVCMLLSVVCVCISYVFSCTFVLHIKKYICAMGMCLCVAFLHFFPYMLMKWKRKCVIICGEYSLKLNRLKTTFPSLSEKMLKGFQKGKKISRATISIFALLVSE